MKPLPTRGVKRSRLQIRDNYFDLGPISHPNWSEAQCRSIQAHLIACARELSRKFPMLTMADMYQAGYCGYLESVKYMTWTIHNSGTTYVKNCARWAMLKESWKIYGRPTYADTGYVGKGDRKNLAEKIGTVSIDSGPSDSVQSERFNSFQHKELSAEWMKGEEEDED